MCLCVCVGGGGGGGGGRRWRTSRASSGARPSFTLHTPPSSPTHTHTNVYAGGDVYDKQWRQAITLASHTKRQKAHSSKVGALAVSRILIGWTRPRPQVCLPPATSRTRSGARCVCVCVYVCVWGGGVLVGKLPAFHL